MGDLARLEEERSGQDERSQALQQIFSAAKGIDQKTMALQYLEALKALGASPATKFVIPTEFTRLVEPITGYVERGMRAESESKG